jgi:glucose/arabinose dehydrogenase/azurin/lysophospholipase L1-like esterase
MQKLLPPLAALLGITVLLISLPDGHAARGANEPAGAASTGQPMLTLKHAEHVAVIGNTLADRMQHDGWLETLVHAKYPTNEIVWRNLAVAGDEVAWRHRSENFGTPDQWLSKVGADVVLAFFGFNESFKGEAGLAKFKQDLGECVDGMTSHNYGGRGKARVILFSPIAAERHQSPNYADPTLINVNLKLYTAAMAEVARSKGVPFVDLFTPSQNLYADAAGRGQSLTINGLHLGTEGNRLLANVIYRAIVGEPAPDTATLSPQLKALRAAVLEKNAQWHGRYRTMDGYNVYGGRSKLEFPSTQPGEKISNYDVMQQEMAQRDVITANRDKAVWAAAQGKKIQIVDNNLPPITPVPSNLKDAHAFQTGEGAIAEMKLAPKLKVNLFASEEQFPELVNPVQMAWDTKGRLWVAAWRNYPERTPTSTVGDSLLVFEDTDGDGKADKCTPFLDNLNCPTGFQFYKDGVLVMQAPDLWFVRDTDGDGRGDKIERVLMGMDSADSHHTTNSMCYEPGGAVFLSDGVFHRTQVETASGPVRNEDACIYRFEPRTGKFERYAPYGFANPHGRVFDRWGRDLITDATGNNTYFGPAFTGHIDYPGKHKGLKQFWERPSRPCPGTLILTTRQFPEEYWGNFLDMNVISFQGIYRVKIKEEGSGFWGESLPDLMSSSDPNFRPTALATGPDGALYVADWSNAIIGHMQHHIRDPNRDHSHGRIYRITYDGRPLLKAPKIDGQPVAALLELLKEPEDQTRTLAKIELDKHDSKEVISALNAWVSSLKSDDPEIEHHVTEALWVHQWHDAVDPDLLKRVLSSPEPRARAAAVRVLSYWRDRVPEALSLLKAHASDEDPRVRLQAVRAASFFDSDQAVDVALEAVKKPRDYYLDYVLGETLRQLQPRWQNMLTEGRSVAAGNPAGLRYLMNTIGMTELLKLPRNPDVLQTILTRPGVLDADRVQALNDLATIRKVTPSSLLLDQIEGSMKSDPQAAANVARLLPMQRADDLKALRQRIEPLTVADVAANGFNRPVWAALAMADGSFDAAWAQAEKSPAARVELLYGIPLLYDTDLREKAFPKFMPLVTAERQDENVRRAAIAAAVSIQSQQPAVAAALADLIHNRRSVGAAARGLRALPIARWSRAHGQAVANDLVAWARTIPDNRRTQGDYVEAIQLAGDLAATMHGEEAASLRRELKDLRVAVFSVTAVREQMRYDTTTIVVEAGKPFEIVFENTDFMPHNLVVVKPGMRPQIGAASMKMRPDEVDKEGRAFIPRAGGLYDAILGGTHLLEAGQKESLKLKAIAEEGVYEYVCTYPGHWEQMWGRLVVTKDVDAYLRDAKPLAASDAAAPSGAHKHHDKK